MKKSTLYLTVTIAFGAGFALSRVIAATPQTGKQSLGRVTGIGGVFFKCKDPETLKAWYTNYLGLNTDRYGTNFTWWQGADNKKRGSTQWSLFSDKTHYFAPSEKDFMINYRVDNLDALLAKLKNAGVTPVDKIDDEKYGRFVHIMDPEGNKIELWEPNDTEYDKTIVGRTQ